MAVFAACPKAASQVGSKLATIEHGAYPVEKGSKFLFDAPILLRSTWGCILEVNSQPFLVADPLEGLILSCIIAAKALYLQIELNF